MPLHVGRITTYQVRSGFESHICDIKVRRPVPVDGTSGYELFSTLGVSRLAWSNGELIASQAANAWFNPPVPILAADGAHRSWHGTIVSLDRRVHASGDLSMTRTRLQLGGRELDTIEANLLLTLPRGAIELTSWFEPGTGLVQQEQRTNDKLVTHMEIVGTPRE
jgi:hypothetical protein